MDQEEFITIKEFAQRAGVSHQAIYDRLRKENDELRKYTKVHNGKKQINTKALELFCYKETTPVIEQQIEIKDEIIALLRKHLACKEQQLKMANELIEKQQAALNFMQESYHNLLDELTRMADRLNMSGDGENLTMKN